MDEELFGGMWVAEVCAGAELGLDSIKLGGGEGGDDDGGDELF